MTEENRYRGTPFAGSEMSSADRVTHHRLNASSCQQGHLVAPPPLSCFPGNPDRDDYRCDKEIRITLLAVEKNPKQVNINEE